MIQDEFTTYKPFLPQGTTMETAKFENLAHGTPQLLADADYAYQRVTQMMRMERVPFPAAVLALTLLLCKAMAECERRIVHPVMACTVEEFVVKTIAQHLPRERDEANTKLRAVDDEKEAEIMKAITPPPVPPAELNGSN